MASVGQKLSKEDMTAVSGEFAPCTIPDLPTPEQCRKANCPGISIVRTGDLS